MDGGVSFLSSSQKLIVATFVPTKVGTNSINGEISKAMTKVNQGPASHINVIINKVLSTGANGLSYHSGPRPDFVRVMRKSVIAHVIDLHTAHATKLLIAVEALLIIEAPLAQVLPVLEVDLPII